MIQDRGNIKWTAMMLPEHVGMLRSWQEENKRIEKPELDEFELELIADEITRADAQTGLLKLQIGLDSVRININNIVKVE